MESTRHSQTDQGSAGKLIVKNLDVWFDADFLSLKTFTSLVKPVSSKCVILDSILLRKWLSLLQMPWLVVVWTIVTLFRSL